MGFRNEKCKTLPNELVERIVSLLPFPSIFKARCLSKSWEARFSSVSSQDDEAKRRLAISFQTQVRRSSNNWGTFCPVFIGKERELIAYEKATHNWRKLPSVSFLPTDVKLAGFNLQMEGALLYASVNNYSQTYVANIITRSWKRLPPPPAECYVHSAKLVVTERSKETYQVILFCERDLYDFDFHFVQIYYSESESWSSKKLVDGIFYDMSLNLNSAYRNGILYTVSPFSPPNLWAFNVEDSTFEELSLFCDGDVEDYVSFYLVLCDDDLLMVAGLLDEVLVMRIDLESLSLRALSSSTGPPNTGPRDITPVGEGCHIFFGYVGECGSKMRAYNICDVRWSSPFAPPTSVSCQSSWIGSFEPGLNPFAEV